jgi:enoyl-[acyl-carrier protein] reductase I
VRPTERHSLVGSARAGEAGTCGNDAFRSAPALDLGQKNIRVNAISAGPVRTLAARSIAGFPTMESIVGGALAAPQADDSDDVGAATAYLLSDEADNVTATTLYVDSGYHAIGM